jgi:hypothetical protein
MKKLPACGLLAMATLLATNAPARAVDPADVKDAIDRGVTYLRRWQGPNGKWPHTEIGATALAGLTLLECGAKPDDKAVQQAADAVRSASLSVTHTYSIALSILFLDRLGDAGDVPLIESLMVRLLAGQNAEGGWSYTCPSISAAEVRRLQGKLNERKELVDRREPSKPREGKRTVKDLPEEIREQLERIERGAPLGGSQPGGGQPGGGQPGGAPPGAPGGFPPPGGAVPVAQWGPGDNSNTQFAALALWVGRRHGLPVERALTKLDRRFRGSQMEDGGWTYSGMPRGGPAMPPAMMGMGTTASMTCAGLLALAIVDGATLELIKDRKPEKAPPDISKDKHLMKGLEALGAVLGDPQNLRLRPMDQFLPPEKRVGGRTYYFLWSLERVAVALGLDTIGKKDWYSWGAEILLANQGRDGGWRGDYGDCGADTCFALLFLRRANLARDLTAHLKGTAKDPGARELRGVTLDPRRPSRKMQSGIESKDAKPVRKPDADARPADPESARLSKDLVKESGARQMELLEEMQKGKGPRYTEALAAAIPQLDGQSRRKAREALAERLTRMKDDTLSAYLQDEDAEIRRAAALACAMKDSKSLTPNVIALLRDPEMAVVRAAHAALKEMTGQDFGPTANASREDRDQATLKWLQWWSQKKK